MNPPWYRSANSTQNRSYPNPNSKIGSDREFPNPTSGSGGVRFRFFSDGFEFGFSNGIQKPIIFGLQSSEARNWTTYSSLILATICSIGEQRMIGYPGSWSRMICLFVRSMVRSDLPVRLRTFGNRPGTKVWIQIITNQETQMCEVPVKIAAPFCRSPTSPLPLNEISLPISVANFCY